MFLRVTEGGYDRGGQQWARGPFLWVVLGPDTPFRQARAFVRHVQLHQCGHFMMGTIRVGKFTQTISGTYGADGLPDTTPQHVYAAGMPIPADIMEIWANSTSGHNGPGAEYRDIRSWAHENLSVLRRAGRNLSCT
jgi:hypothetical protein